MNESIENINLSNSDVRTSKFNKKSLILILNYFISPILILIVFFNLLKNSTIMENLMSSGFVSIFLKIINICWKMKNYLISFLQVY